ncbi:hypothetical protein NDU88_001093, partial [Pleurodeles waltl]
WRAQKRNSPSSMLKRLFRENSKGEITREKGLENIELDELEEKLTGPTSNQHQQKQ